MLCSRRFPRAKKFMDQRRKESIKLFRRKVLSHSAKSFRRGTLLRCVSENFRQRKSLSIRGEERGVSRFAVEIFLSHSAEKFRTRTLQCFTNFGYRISLEKRGEYQGFPLKLFCLTVPQNFVPEPFNVSLYSDIEKFYALEGYVTFFCRKFLSDSAEIFRWETF